MQLSEHWSGCSPSRAIAAAYMTMDLLVAVGEQQEPGTRTRQEFLKVAKRLAGLVGIDDTDRLDALHQLRTSRRNCRLKNGWWPC